jgi:general secretion pathway protein A
MYETFYGLREKPFAMQPDPDFIYWAGGHRMAYTMLEYGVVNNLGFTVITGEIGCGKTTLVRKLIGQLDSNVTVGLLTNTRITEGELLRWVMLALGQPFEQSSTIGLFRDFERFLIEEYAANRRTILIVDEAQNLGAHTLEELRMLSNINSGKDQLLQCILVGQPQLKNLLQSPELYQFAQRVSSDFHLEPLVDSEVYNYIKHRVTTAGGPPDLFSRQSARLVAEASRGVPRIINMLCDTALVYAYAHGANYVSLSIMETVIEERRKYGLFFS